MLHPGIFNIIDNVTKFAVIDKMGMKIRIIARLQYTDDILDDTWPADVTLWIAYVPDVIR